MTRLRLPAIAALLALGATLAVTAQSNTTDAAWSDTTNAAGSFTALTVAAPTIVSCTAGGNVVTPTLSLQWSFPAGSGYTSPTNVNLYYSNNGLIPNLLPITSGATTTGPVGGVYTTTYSIGLLGGILSTQAAIALETKVDGWTSPRVARVATWPLLIGTATCVAP
jgi:hypothetical protein